MDQPWTYPGGIIDMNRIVPAFFALLRAGLWERDVEPLSLFPIPDRLWDNIFLMARQQTVTGLVYRGITHLPDGMLPSSSRMIRLVAEIDRIEKESRAMDNAASAIFQEFRKNNISAVLQKGQGTAILYRYPELRECGDIDLYFRTDDDRIKAERMMLDNGYRPRRMPDGSSFVKWKGIPVEFHTKLVDLNSPKASRYVARTVTASAFEEVRLGNGSEVTVPGPGLCLLMLSSHIMKHFLGQSIGLRQICDMAMASHIYRSRYDRAEILEMMKHAGLEKWNRLLYSFMSAYLGLPEESNIYDTSLGTDSGKLLDIVISGGNFGFSGHRKQYRSDKIWRRKIETVNLLLRNFCYSLSIVPEESVWILINLAKGQLK